MRRLGTLSLVALVFCSAPGARAGEQAGRPGAARPLELSLREAVEAALASAERVWSARAGEARAAAQVGEARAAGMPVLSGDAGLTRTKRELTESDLAMQQFAGAMGGADDLVPHRYSNLYTAGVTLTQPLFTGGAVWNSVGAARAAQQAAGEDVRQARMVTVAATAQSYYALLLAGRVRRVQRSTYRLAEKHCREVQAREKAGAATRFEVLRAKVAMQNLEAGVFDAELRERQARVALLRETGAPLDMELKLTSGFEPPAGKPELAASLATAVIARPELRRADHAVRAQELAVRAARAGYYPSISATARWGGQADDEPFADDEFDEYGSLGLELRWSLFDGLMTRSRVASGRAELSRLRWMRSALERDVRRDVRVALLAMESAAKLIEAQKVNVAEAEEAVRLTEVRHKAGAATELDVQTARSQLQEAGLNHVRALYRYSVARLDYLWATGRIEEVEWPGATAEPDPDPEPK